MPELALDRSGPAGNTPILLLHAGVADRRMWEPVWSRVAERRDVVRLDLPGFGGSATRPTEPLSPSRDVLDTLDDLGIDRAHLVGASFGAGVAVEVALSAPRRVGSLLLASPGGALIAEATPALRAFAAAEDAAWAADDLDAAVEANLATWVDGPGQPADRVEAGVRTAVGQMQRRAFEIAAAWEQEGPIEEDELDPPALERLGEIGCPTLVLSGALDLDAIRLAAGAVVGGIAGARELVWPEVAHLPSLERPEAFADLLEEWLREAEAADGR